MLGLSQGLSYLTPAGAVAGAGQIAYNLTTAIINNGGEATAIAVIQGIKGLPENIMAGLMSDDPRVRGETLVTALTIPVVAAAVGRKVGVTVLENIGTGPAAGSRTAQRGGVPVGDVANGEAATADGTANAVTYARLKLDLKTTQAANEVVESLQTTGKLPPNYVDKAQAVQQGWQPGKALNNSVPGGQLGGDVFNNVPPVNGLPQTASRTWQEVDIGLSNTMSRSNQPGTRLLYSNDGLLYITTDHYKTVAPIGTWKK